MLDDYYLNLLDWSSKNVVAIALGNTVYLWHATSGAIEELMQVSQDDGPVTSLSWGPDGKHIGIGLDNGEVQLWDSTSLSKIRTMKGHTARVGSLAWNGGPILSSGSRDTCIFNHDGKPTFLLSIYTTHQQCISCRLYIHILVICLYSIIR